MFAGTAISDHDVFDCNRIRSKTNKKQNKKTKKGKKKRRRKKSPLISF